MHGQEGVDNVLRQTKTVNPLWLLFRVITCGALPHINTNITHE